MQSTTSRRPIKNKKSTRCRIIASEKNPPGNTPEGSRDSGHDSGDIGGGRGGVLVEVQPESELLDSPKKPLLN